MPKKNQKAGQTKKTGHTGNGMKMTAASSQPLDVFRVVPAVRDVTKGGEEKPRWETLYVQS